MKKAVVFILFIVIGFSSFAQTDFSFEDFGKIEDSSNAKIGIWFETNYNSNVLNNSVYYNAVFQTGVTRQSMNNMEARVLGRNIAGTQETERLYYSWKSKKSSDSSKLIHNINIGTRRAVNIGFGKDAFLLAGFGNKKFAGKTAYIDDMNLNLLQFTQIQYGMIKEQKNKISYGVGLAFLMGNRYGNYFLNSSSLYTSDIGDSVSGIINGHLTMSDTSAKNLYDISGYGGSIDALLSFPVNWLKKQDDYGSLKIELNELGLISWKNTLRYNLNGQMDWAGIQAPTFAEIGDSIYNDQVPRNIQDDFVESTETTNLTTVLSPRIAIYYTEKLNDNIELRNMIDYRFNANYLPFLASTQVFRITKTDKKFKYFLNVHESLGGYGYFGFGLGAELRHKKFGAVLGTRNLIAMTVPEVLSGFNVHLGFKWNFK